ncbi:MAG: DUF58 domain-containing protein [Pseudomonadales bacterium]|nr:DUF58 domain-containing protein [Pseudomonadales bacterium]
MHLESTMILHPDPLALFYGVTRFDNPQQLLVLPKRYRVSRQFEMPGGRHFQPGGVNPTWSIGESDEFVSLRDYRDGDSLRKIHWASTAKRDKPVVKEFQDEYFVRQALVLDTAVDDPDILEETIAVAAGFVLQSDTSDSLLDLIYTSNKVEVITAGRGYARTNQQLEALATAGKTTVDPDLLTRAVLKHADLISGCILIFGAWDESRQRMLDQLRAINIPTEAFLITRDDDLAEDVRSKAHILPINEIQERLLSL